VVAHHEPDDAGTDRQHHDETSHGASLRGRRSPGHRLVRAPRHGQRVNLRTPNVAR
jgi:hypothetical protein